MSNTLPNSPIKSKSINHQEPSHHIFHSSSSSLNKRPTHKLSRSSSLTSNQSYSQSQSPSKSQSRPTSPIKSTSSPLIIHRNQKQSSSRPITPINLKPLNHHHHHQVIKSSDIKNQNDSLDPIKEITSPSISNTHHSLSSTTSPQSENISVCIRLRPLPSSSLSDIDLDTPPPNKYKSVTTSSSSDQKINQFGPWIINPSLSQISLSSSHPIIDKRGTGTSEAINGSEGYEFTLDSIYNPYSTTQDLYEGNVQKVIKSCVRDGYNVTVFAYGQTGSGKTFTMMGSDQDVENKGIVPRSIDEVFQVISQEDQNREYLLRISYLEIYNETLKDLLSDGTPQKLTIHENQKGRVYVNGLREEVVTHPLQVITTLQKGEKARHVGATDWNERSSRSHTVFTMTIESRPRDSEELIQTGIQISQLNLIDLAGSESAASSIERRKEGSFINKSLLSLSNVISKLATSEPHVPYRDSKLTRLLQTSLGGNAKVVVICAVSVNNDSVGETLSTLRFARRAKMVITKAERGTILDDKSALLQSYQQEIISLKAQLLNNSQALSLSNSGSSNLEVEVEKSKAMSDVAELQLERIRLQEQIEHLNRRILTRNTIQSNVRRASSSISQVTPIQVESHPAHRQRRGRLTDFGGLVSHGGNLGGGMFNVGLRASLLPNILTTSKEIELEKELAKLKSDNQAKESELQLAREREIERLNQEESRVEELRKEIKRLEDERLSDVKGLEDKIKLKDEEIDKYQTELVTKTEESQASLVQTEVKESGSNSEIESLRAELLTAQTVILELKQTEDEKARLEKELKESEIKLGRVEKKYSNERTKVHEIQFELMQITQSRDGLENEMKEKLEETKRFELELAEVKEVLEKEKKTISETKEESEESKKVVELMKDENKELKDELDRMKNLVEGQDKVLIEEKTKLEEELKQLQQLSEDREKAVLDEKKKLEKELIELKASLGEKETVMDREKEQVQLELFELQKSVEKKRNEMESETEKLKETLSKQEKEMIEVRDKLEGQVEEIGRLMKEEAEKARLEKQGLEKDLKELQKSMKEKESERIQLEGEVKELKGLVDGKSDEMIEENERLNKDITELKHLLDESESEKTKLKDQLDRTESYRIKSEELSSKLSASEHKLRKTQEEANLAEQMVTKLKKENEEADKTGRVQNREVERLARELSEVKQTQEGIEKKLESKYLQSQSELRVQHRIEIEKLQQTQSNLTAQIKRLENELKQARENQSSKASKETNAESMETIVELQMVIEEQSKEIEELIQELKRTQFSTRSNQHHEHIHHQAEDEIERLNLIIDEQKKMLSDAKTDMAKWQGHLKSQQAIIAKIQGNPTSEHTIGSLPKPSLSMNSTMNRIVSKSSAPPMSTNNNLGNYPTSLLGGPTSLSGTSLNASTSYSNRNSPRPLPVPDSFEDHDEEWRRRKNRRKTIEQDMAKLRDENVVERKRNVLMSSSPRNMTSKPKRNLSGLSSRVNRLNNLNQFETHEIIPPLPSSNKTLNERLKD